MEKVAKLLGVDKDVREAVKNVVLLLLTAISLSFTAGRYFGKAKELPEQVATMYVKQEQLERRQDIMEATTKSQFETIIQKLDSQNQDMRELRSVVLEARRR